MRWTTLVVREPLGVILRLTKIEDAFLADIVIKKGLCIFELLPAVDETQRIIGRSLADAAGDETLETWVNATLSQGSNFGACEEKKKTLTYH